ncbi:MULTISPECIES: hypothetical protein [Vibrio harveyi group]|uniref:hypothetical protein n=1 Tax=Vibrio harveyi group TaxID=717610 RepID=UPI001122F39C|nr:MULTISPECIES: hypothetical protein [Vibrio harveyi group]MCQ9070896.1 hypothetical protein [Vibrio alginolyticus]TOJ14137.1 hypothetical protein CGI45_18635 [Vibrio parahaemolyticus]
MLNTAIKQNAADTHHYYLEEMKHEISRAYYDHYESLLKSEEFTLALEVYFRSYSYADAAKIKEAGVGYFAARTIKFYIKDESGNSHPVRLNLSDPVVLPQDHTPITLSFDDELAVHYRGLMERIRQRRDSEELAQLLSRIDAMARRMPMSMLRSRLKQEGGYVIKAIKGMYLRMSLEDIKTKS